MIKALVCCFRAYHEHAEVLQVLQVKYKNVLETTDYKC